MHDLASDPGVGDVDEHPLLGMALAIDVTHQPGVDSPLRAGGQDAGSGGGVGRDAESAAEVPAGACGEDSEPRVAGDRRAVREEAARRLADGSVPSGCHDQGPALTKAAAGDPGGVAGAGREGDLEIEAGAGQGPFQLGPALFSPPAAGRRVDDDQRFFQTPPTACGFMIPAGSRAARTASQTGHQPASSWRAQAARAFPTP